ncbi:hypothetical protein [Actinomadura sp. KC345]|uniref:hypothetical protein n=1 Tax=Actinomadura sp. KC345 TaxID=2530371 RepID=UPI001404DD17|nr:hypothetical protein [Actinomadura sp. KC345]
METGGVVDDLRLRLTLAVLREWHARPLRTLEHRPNGTNGYVSRWGTIACVSPPEAG